MSDRINHPSHYTRGGIEAIDAIEAWDLGFNLGNALKYIARAGHKDGTDPVEDLRKARWYLDREIARRSSGGEPSLHRIPQRDLRQQLVTDWARRAFGEAEATSIPQRGLRLLEEAIEAYQACGGTEELAHKLVAFVFSRPAGSVGQELGGVATTVLALAAAAGISAEDEECREIDRVLNKPVKEFTARNASKNEAGFLVSELDRAREAYAKAACGAIYGVAGVSCGLPKGHDGPHCRAGGDGMYP